MNGVCSTMTWCAMQVSLVALLGIVISFAFAQRNASLACCFVCIAALASGLLTIVAPLPVHRCFMLGNPPISTTIQSPAKVPPGPRTLVASPQGMSPSASAAVPVLGLRGLIDSLRTLAMPVELLDHRRRLAIQTTTCVAVGFIVVGLLRLAVAFAFVVRMRRGGVMPTDPGLLDAIRELSTKLNCRVVPEIRENADFSDAAVAGWFRPTLILPGDWRQWSIDEQRAVLAHELAHIVRRDTLWRTLVSCVLAMHFYNPILHWLSRRVRLYQELVADAIAAAVVGQRSYLHSLSSLALRRDDQLRGSVAPDLLPVFSGHLMRRIKVLNSKDGRPAVQTPRRRASASALISMTFLGLSLATVATRGIAQPPDAGPRETVGNVQPVSFTRAAAENKTVADPTREMFRYPPLDPAMFGQNNPLGMVCLRPGVLLRRDDMQSYAPLLNGMLSAWLMSELKSAAPPAVNTEIIEWMASVPELSFTSEAKEQKSKVQFGVRGLVLKLSQPINLKQWVDRFAPKAKRHVVEGTDVFELTFASLGPAPCCVWLSDETTIRIWSQEVSPETKLTDLKVPPIAKQNGHSKTDKAVSTGARPSPSWTATWNRIDTGLGSLVLGKADLGGLINDLDHRPDMQSESIQAIGRAGKALVARCVMTAISFDTDKDRSRIGVRLSLVHGSREAAALSARDIREILSLTSGEFAKHLNVPEDKSKNTARSEEERHLIRLYEDAFQAATISLDEYDDKTAALVISTTIPFEKVVELVMLAATEPSSK